MHLTEERRKAWLDRLEAELGPEVMALGERIAAQGGVPPDQVYPVLRGIARTLSGDILGEVACEPLEDAMLDPARIRAVVRDRLNRRGTGQTHCTAGAATLEVRPDGSVSRCSKTAMQGLFFGRIDDPDGPPRLAPDPAKLRCDLRCPPQMCFSRQVFRANGHAAFVDGLADGATPPASRPGHARPDIFIRWKLTNRCNFRCSYCTDWRSVNKGAPELTDEAILAAAQRLTERFGRISLRLTGGEPAARRCYVDLMRHIHRNLDRFTDIELRTNLSFGERHREVLAFGWDDRLKLHVGCHVDDKGFMPWRFPEVLAAARGASWLLKFVATPANRDHVAFFRRYLEGLGIPPARIVVTEEVRGVAAPPGPAPLARIRIESGTIPADPADRAAPARSVRTGGLPPPLIRAETPAVS